MLRANGLPETVIVNEIDSNRSSKVDSKISSTAVYDNENPVLRHRSKRVTTKRFTKVYESPTASDNEEYAELWISIQRDNKWNMAKLNESFQNKFRQSFLIHDACSCSILITASDNNSIAPGY